MKSFLKIFLIIGGVIFWSFAFIYASLLVYSVLIYRFSVPLPNGYMAQTNKIYYTAEIYDKTHKRVLSGVGDFSVDKGFVFGYAPDKVGQYFFLNTANGDLLRYIDARAYGHALNERKLTAKEINISAIRSGLRQPYWIEMADASSLSR